ncbi:MAG: hypothetical protein CVV50_00255 [Spirochaetae bacterium HGW-Spirochaetae-6]|jgi:hypothetical protein|nr:MAG: hypothetical protein CVV50_00255 [Spirochaetae bacterium HGW-Spirochaetae-6]
MGYWFKIALIVFLNLPLSLFPQEKGEIIIAPSKSGETVIKSLPQTTSVEQEKRPQNKTEQIPQADPYYRTKIWALVITLIVSFMYLLLTYKNRGKRRHI